MSALESRELQRLRYWQGQTIRSQDFRDQVRIERQLRAWHNRALHNVYGVAKKLLDGLRVEPTVNGVVVHSGLAYDLFGRELLLGSQVSILFGDQREPMFLVLRSKESCGCDQASTTAANCLGTKQSLIATNNDLIWLPVKGFSFGDGVPIARTLLTGNVVSIDADFISPSVRPLARPKIGVGATIPGATTWEIWDLKLFDNQARLSIQVKIDTSSAGFATVPQYFAALQGPLSQVDQNALSVICLHFDHIDQLRPDSFVFRFLILLIKFTPGRLEVQKYLQQQKAYVSWIGIERIPGST
ncbi:MAG TPA: hypothetical protein VMZ30_02440 [Pyrinomonadaceae bacterium]|nr:hypothetical protein [Pyrinomonadaceae bacterium]